ncbi:MULTISPECIES: hypothetical protein [Pyrobaculum]|nr:hypothetical protein [Pyrobaculum arsenaticum]
MKKARGVVVEAEKDGFKHIFVISKSVYVKKMAPPLLTTAKI